MRAIVRPRLFTGTFRVPASKSHTIRRLFISALADGKSVLENPLDSLDARSCVSVCRAFGAEIEEVRLDAEQSSNANPIGSDGKQLARWIINGVGAGKLHNALRTPENVIDVGNSGTTLYLALALAALGEGGAVFTGDAQIRKRSAAPLLAALNSLGADAFSTRGDGAAPIVIRGPFKGGRAKMECPTSQYLSALLLAAPLAPSSVVCEIDVPLLNEKPYVAMTLAYLKAQGVELEHSEDLSYFKIQGGHVYKPMCGTVPGDFSSAAFPACAAAVTGGPVTLQGLDPDDTQGDKAVFTMLERMGCTVEWSRDEKGEHGVTIGRTGPLIGRDIDLNNTPDALPVLAAIACYAGGETGLLNVPNARIKETDRLAVMANELRKLGGVVEELSDALIVRGAGGRGGPALNGGSTMGHDDHRVVMALAVAALGAAGPVEIDSAESAAVTYPGFLELLGAETRL